MRIAKYASLLKVVRPYTRWLLVIAVALLLAIGCGLGAPLLVTRLLNSAVKSHEVRGLNKTSLILIGLFLAQASFTYIHTYLTAYVGERVTYDLRKSLYAKLQSLSLNFYDSNRTGELLSRLTNDVGQVRLVLTSSLPTSLSQTATLLGSLGIVLFLSPRLTLFIVLVAPVAAFCAALFGRRIESGGTKIQDELANCSVIADETLQSMKLVKSFGRETFEVSRFLEAADTALRTSLNQARDSSSFNSLMLFIACASMTAIIWYAGLEVIQGRLSIGLIAGFLMYGMMIAGSISGLMRLYGQLRELIGSVKRVVELFEVKVSVHDQPNASPLPTVLGSIKFSDVSFEYVPGNPVLDKLALDIEPGEIFALTGPSGAGKTTVLNLISRFYDCSSGSISIDGIDLRSATQASLRAQIGLVPQDTILFGGTVAENIRYGKLDANDAEVIAAAKEANAHDFIIGLNDGYKTRVGDQGSRLSGGQRQRIAIARAILKNPRILLLDEATSSLDAESEQAVQEAFKRLMQGRTTIVIAHRLSTIRSAHRIAYLDEGRIVEIGSHNFLMNLRGRYSRVYSTQFRP